MDDTIITDALATAGELTRTVAANLQRQGYTVHWDGITPDDVYAMTLLANALIDDATGTLDQNDYHTAWDGTSPREQRAAARMRLDQRRQLADALTERSPEDRRRLIDSLADSTAHTIAS